MTPKFTAPAMVGRMSPPLFSQGCLMEPHNPRFASYPFVAVRYWMHADGCRPGSFSSRPANRQRGRESDWFLCALPPVQAELFQGCLA
jgi:hypothetical protein